MAKLDNKERRPEELNLERSSGSTRERYADRIGKRFEWARTFPKETQLLANAYKNWTPEIKETWANIASDIDMMMAELQNKVDNLPTK